MEVTIDFETRSTVDLKTCGAFVYAESPDTEIMCLSVAVDNDRPLIWIPDKFLVLIDPGKIRYDIIREQELLGITAKADKIIAQNSMFEYLMWNWVMMPRREWPQLPMEKLHDTMAQLAYHALPLNLDQAGSALNLSLLKDKTGHKTMLKLCKPRTPRKAEQRDDPDWESKTWWHEDPADIETLCNYCCGDVETERLIYHTLSPLPEFERKIWLLDQQINLKGVPVDIPNVKKIVDVIQQHAQNLTAEFTGLTGGAVKTPRSYVALRNWVNGQLGTELASIDKVATKELLDGTLPEDGLVRRVLEIKSELSKASVAKFEAMLRRTNRDGRLRGMFQYGAASTMRWGGRGVQLHNLIRDSYKPGEWNLAAKLFGTGDTECIQLILDDPFFAASKCVRGALCTGEQTEFVCSDFSSVEGRGLAFLAGEEEALHAYRSGLETYKTAAQSIFNVEYDDVTKEQRQVGKVSELALGYNGGIGAYAAMAKGYGIDLETLPPHIMPYATKEELDGPYGAVAIAKAYLKRNPGTMSSEAAIACDVIKRKWRASHPMTCRFWRGLEQAAYMAIENPGQIYSYRDIKYRVHDRWLKCLLPSGRLMQYFDPKIKPIKTDWDSAKLSITYYGVKVVEGKTTRQWARLSTYGGKLAENVVQGYCRDLLAYAMLNLDKAGYPLLLHVHDEAAAEVPAGTGDVENFNRIMSVNPPWAENMPLEAAGWIGRRYRK